MRPLVALPFLALLAACPGRAPRADVPAPDATDDAPPAGPPQFTVFVAPAQLGAVSAWAAQTRLARVAALVSDSPRDDLAAGRGDGIRVAAVADATGCTECYRLERASPGYVVHGDGALGLQYGLTHLLEAHGYRFLHPFAGHAPPDPATATVDPAAFDHTFAPEQRVRGLHLHTLHPIESLAFWVPSSTHLAQARAILDWTVKNRGNYVQVAALDDIRGGGAVAWRPHMRAILDEAHARGMRFGINVQLFGDSSLQKAFTLLPSSSDPAPDVTIRANLHTVLDGLPFDSVNLSFGEFAGADPATFIARVNLATSLLAELAPGTEVSATVHLGNYPALQVTYMGRTLNYYDLVQYCDPRIVPWIHSVMYYTLFDDAGGAYLYDDFSDHRAYLLARLAAHQPVVYNPESAYWIAFDDSVPQYLPVYIRSRWRDLTQIRAAAAAQGGDALTAHAMFSSGWEWGYWQTDASVLRMGFALPDHWEAPLEDMFAPWGAAGASAAAAIGALGDAQFDALITHRIAPYIAARDVLIDTGEATMGIVSQPTRPSFATVAHYDATARAAFATDVLAPLDGLASASDGVLARVAPLADGAPDDPWLAELRDGAAVDAARAHFAAAVWHAAASFGATGSDAGYLAQAQAALADGTTVVARRHASLHWPEPARLLGRTTNPTAYPIGYLYFADQLCYWQRELVQLNALLQGTSVEPPGCFLVD